MKTGRLLTDRAPLNTSIQSTIRRVLVNINGAVFRDVLRIQTFSLFINNKDLHTFILKPTLKTCTITMEVLNFLCRQKYKWIHTLLTNLHLIRRLCSHIKQRSIYHMIRMFMLNFWLTELDCASATQIERPLR